MVVGNAPFRGSPGKVAPGSKPRAKGMSLAIASHSSVPKAKTSTLSFSLTKGPKYPNITCLGLLY